MKILNAIGRVIKNPLAAAVICVVGGAAIWFVVKEPPEGAPEANVRGKPGTGRGSSAATETDDAQRSRKARGAIASSGRGNARERKATGRQDDEVVHYQATNESPTPRTAATDSPEPLPRATEAESPSDAIGPRDPRARALAEYQTKKAETPAAALDQKRLAQWCDNMGLWEQAKTHWEAALRLDPKSDEALKRLGFRLRGGRWILDAASAETAAQKKASIYWQKELAICHKRMKCRSKGAVPARADAVAQVEAVGDPRAAEMWKVFAFDARHHGLLVGILSRFKTREASQMLAALAVYSLDIKAQAAAVAALRGRGVADYGKVLISLMHNRMRVEERTVPIPGSAPARELFVAGDKANYQFLFSRVEAPATESMAGCFQPRLSASETAMAKQFNQNEAETARQALDQQVALAKQMIEKYNDSIRALNERVARVLNEACSAGIRPEPEDGRRWLALALGPEYKPAADRPKPTFTEIVSPLYNPTFLPIPAAT